MSNDKYPSLKYYRRTRPVRWFLWHARWKLRKLYRRMFVRTIHFHREGWEFVIKHDVLTGKFEWVDLPRRRRA
jgi:hypothetical protein